MAQASDYDAVIVDDWDVRLNEINDNTGQLNRLLEKDTTKVESDEFRVPLHTSRNQGIGARSETGTLAPAGKQGTKRAVYAPKHNWIQVAVTEFLMTLAEQNLQKFLGDMQIEFDGAIKDMTEDRDRQFWGDGTGLLGTAGTTSASTTVTMGSAADVKLIFPNMRVDILTKATGAVKGSDRKVVSVNKTAGTFVIDGDPVTTDSNDGVYRQGNSYASGGALVSNETNGLANIIDSTGALGGLNPATATEEFWASGEFGSIAALSEEEIQKAWDYPAENGYTGSMNRIVISTFGVRREYGKLLQAKKQYQAATTRDAKAPKLVGGGFDALEYNNTDWLADRKCQAQTAYIIDLEHIADYQIAKPSWKKRQGKVLVDDGGTGYVAKRYVFENVGTNNRAAHAKLTGVTESP